MCPSSHHPLCLELKQRLIKTQSARKRVHTLLELRYTTGLGWKLLILHLLLQPAVMGSRGTSFSFPPLLPVSSGSGSSPPRSPVLRSPVKGSARFKEHMQVAVVFMLVASALTVLFFVRSCVQQHGTALVGLRVVSPGRSVLLCTQRQRPRAPCAPLTCARKFAGSVDSAGAG